MTGTGTVIGVDVGTTVTKAVAFDRDSRATARAERPSRLLKLLGGRAAGSSRTWDASWTPSPRSCATWPGSSRTPRTPWR